MASKYPGIIIVVFFKSNSEILNKINLYFAHLLHFIAEFFNLILNLRKKLSLSSSTQFAFKDTHINIVVLEKKK